jgi:type IV pilus assembly protein PilA
MFNRNEKGFTLIELMIVIAIIGILAAIAIPQFNSYRSRSYNAGALSDMKNIQTALEAYYVDHQHYPNAVDVVTDATNPIQTNYGYTRTKGVTDGGNIVGDKVGYTVGPIWNSLATATSRTSYSLQGPGKPIKNMTPP